MAVEEERSIPPQVDLKPFPSSSKYAYLNKNETYLVVVNAELNNTQLDQLIALIKSLKVS